MSQVLADGNSVVLPVVTGQSLRVTPYYGTYTARIIAGAASLPVSLAAASAVEGTHGPWAQNVVIELSAAVGAAVDWDVAVLPVTNQTKPVSSNADGSLNVNGRKVAVGVVTQPTKDANYTLISSDSGDVIPVTGTRVVTLNAASDLSEAVELLRVGASGSISVTMTGVTVINPATGSAWSPLSITNEGSAIIITPVPGTADRYVASKVGA